MTEVSRKWVTSLDAKAAFLVALNGALLTFIWSSAKLPECNLAPVKWFGILATLLLLASMLYAANAVFPRIRLDVKPSVPSVSFFGHVAGMYEQSKGSKFADDVLAFNDTDLIREILEQHHAISHVAMIKYNRIQQSAQFWIVALTTTLFTLILKSLG